MKHGKLFWHSANERIGVYFEDGSSNDGLHCGQCMEVLVSGQWMPTRIEFCLDDWMLVGCFAPGKIPCDQKVRM